MNDRDIENVSPSAFDDGRAVPGLGGPEEGLGGRGCEEPRGVPADAPEVAEHAEYA